ncbi:MAG: response regulator [Bacteroidota bacterium]
MTSKILIVDDEPDLEELIRQKFRRKIAAGEYQFEFAHNGIHALDKINSEGEYSLVFTDINMPEMDGLALLARIKELDPAFKTIVVSAYGDMENIRTAMNRGAFDFLTKPIDFTDFETTLTKSLFEFYKIQEGITAKENLVHANLEKERAEQSEKFKQQFLANMSHEIRTPLNAIKGMTLMLLKEKLKEEQQRNLEIIRKSTDNLIVIINDILDMSKIEAGKLELEKIDFSPAETLQNVYELLRFKAEEKKIEFKIKVATDLPEAIIGDPVRLGQVLMNLAGNSIKFTESGSVTAEAKLIATENNIATVEFSVTDTGIGMTPEQLDKIFESFSQASKETYRKFGGTGLGLTISKSLVELMGGKLAVKSKYGEGTTFYFSAPFPIGDVTKLEKNANANVEVPVIKNISILLFEDNLFNQIAAQQILASSIEGLKMEIAENGLIGFEKLKTTDYDVVLMDIQMPELDGYQATEKIRAELEGSRKNIPIIAMTANAIKEEIMKCMEVGMDDFITKPFEPNDLLIKISKVLNKKR